MELNKKRIILFLTLTFLITYIFEFGIITPMIQSINVNTQMTAQLLIASVMFIPALGVLLTRIITKEGFKDCYLRPHFKGHISIYLLAWFGPFILTILGMLAYFILVPGSYDTNLGYMQLTMESAGVNLTVEQLKSTMIIQIITGVIFAPILNILTCFGEEWGWRGYLLPKMMKHFKIQYVLLITRIIWGLWHAPLTMLGHNYGFGYWGFPFTGILAMCLFCIVIGVFLSYITIKTKSCLPAIISHGALNGFASIGMFFTKDGGNPFIGPAPTGIIGGVAFIIIGIIMLLLLMKNKTVESI